MIVTNPVDFENIHVDANGYPKRYYDDMEALVIDENTMLYVDDLSRLSFVENNDWWLMVDGQVVAYMRTLRYKNQTEHAFVLCDIEVRTGHQGKGYARRIIELAIANRNQPLYTTGGCTPEGYAALQWLPLLPDAEFSSRYRSMTFVEDFDAMCAKNT